MSTWAKIIIGDSRAMPEVATESVHLVVTSPPYWHLKDYGQPGQIGFGQSLHEYLKDLYRVWRECLRVLQPGRRLCINIGDQFARAAAYGRYKIIPLHAEIIGQCEELGFDFLGAIIWQKKTTLNPSGGATVMGSFPFPPNGLVELDYEFILIFKKPGKIEKVSKETKEASKLSKEEWKEYFSGHWHFGGARQIGHGAMFPEELPRRLIRMFSFVGDTVLDPFLGSGTTAKVALETGRKALGYEINREFLAMIREKLNLVSRPPFGQTVRIIFRAENFPPPSLDYLPRVPDAGPVIAKGGKNYKQPGLRRVVQIVDESTVRMEDGESVRFYGVQVKRREEAFRYLSERLLGKRVFLRYVAPEDGQMPRAAMVYLKNRICINKYLIKARLALPTSAV
jgi:DNA modification methylase